MQFDSNDRVCSAGIGGVAMGHAERRYERANALGQIAELLITYRIPADRHAAVLSLALHAHTGDADWRDPAVRSLLLEAGADLELAKEIHRDTFRR